MAAESTTLELELPECPVCLQQYGDVSTIPRVLPCGHSACQDCLTHLQNPFPGTIRCPACTQLVKLPNPISSLPKNIDLLRFSNLPHHHYHHHNNYSKGSHVSTQKYDKDPIFIKPPLWSHEFYSTWKTWVLPEDAIIIESNASVCYGKVLKVSNSVSYMGCALKEGEKVSLLEIGYFAKDSYSSSKFEYSYEVKLMTVLYGLSEGERSALESIIKESLALHVMCKVYGFWYNMDNHCVYMVSETFSGSLLGKMGVLRNAVLEKNAEEKISNAAEFVIVGLDICQTVNDLHLRGLVPGFLGLSCFGFDKYGRVYIDISEVLATGRRVRKILTEFVVGKTGTASEDLVVRLKSNMVEDCVFVSPEVFFELSKLGGIVIDLGSSRHHVGCGSDIWSLACAIISILAGKSFAEEMQNYLSYLVTAVRDEKCLDFVRWYVDWRQKIISLIECRLLSEFTKMKEILLKCLEYNPENRPLISELWKILKVLVIKSELDDVKDLEQEIKMENMCNCLILGDFCQSINKVTKQSPRCLDDTSVVENANAEEADGVENFGVDKDVVEGLSCGQVKCIALKGHRNCITGLAIGGGFLFSSSFDKMVNVWSLQIMENHCALVVIMVAQFAFGELALH